jgi:hypothetical protein
VNSPISLSPATASPPNIPSKPTAQAELNALTVAAEGSMSGNSRSLFPHWTTTSGSCDTGRWIVRLRTGHDALPVDFSPAAVLQSESRPIGKPEFVN